jgi:ankyrin repeat protein
MQYGSYQNTNLLEFFVGAGANMEVLDKSNHTPLYYASLQRNGVMRECLLDLGAPEEEVTENQIERVTSSILNNFKFPEVKYDFEEDF